MEVNGYLDRSPGKRQGKGQGKEMDTDVIDDIDFGDYHLMITLAKPSTYLSYRACLSYRGNDKSFIQAIKKIEKEQKKEGLCLIQINFAIAPFSSLETEYVVEEGVEGNEDEVLSYFTPSDAHLFGYFNDVREYKLEKYEPTKKLKGIVHVIFCMILSHAVKEKYLTLNSTITLEASGSLYKTDEEIQKEKMEGKDKVSVVKSMLGLVKHYETLGFKQALPKLLEVGLKEGNVPMKAKVNDILRVCTNHPESRIRSIEKIKVMQYFENMYESS
jgi:hypothetical protein